MSNLSINDLSTGVSSAGMSEYIESLRLDLIVKTGELIDDISAVETELNNGWQGAAKDYFLNDFQRMRELVKEDLEKEHQNLVNRLNELQSELFEIDQNLATELEG